MSRELRGIFPIVATPYDEKGSLDEEALRGLVNHLIAEGTHGLAPCGGSSEARALTREERYRMGDVVMDEVAGRVPVIVGVSAASTEESVILARHASASEADAVFATLPYGSALDDEELIWSHYTAIAEAIDCYLMVQEVGEGMPLRVLAELADELDSFRYVKEEAHHTGHRITRLLGMTDRLAILSGGMTILDDLARGAVGAIPGSCGVGAYSRIFDLYTEGCRDEARREYHRILPLLHWRGRVNHLQATKAVLCRKGVFKNDRVREQPNLEPLDDVDRQELDLILRAIGPPY